MTLKTFLPADLDIAGLTLNQYLARLAAEATTIINAEDYGRTVYDLSIRRDLITIGEDMVNLAYDAPVDATPQSHIEDAERKLYELAETGRYEAASSGSPRTAEVLYGERQRIWDQAENRRHAQKALLELLAGEARRAGSPQRAQIRIRSRERQN